MEDCIDKAAACMSRREFFVKAGLVGGGVVLTLSSLNGTALGAAFEDVTVPVGPDSPLAKVGGSQVIDTSAGKVIVIRTDKAKYAAFSAKCTHKGGTVAYNAEKNQLECPKHGSKWDGSKGSVTSGPAESPLASHVAKGSDTSVTVAITP